MNARRPRTPREAPRSLRTQGKKAGEIIPRWIRKFAVDRVRERKAAINDKIDLMGPGGPHNRAELQWDWSDLQRLTLLDLYVLGKVDVIEDEKRIGRYFAVLKKKPLFVCEITKDAFESLSHTDLPERRRKELLKKRRTRQVESIA